MHSAQEVLLLANRIKFLHLASCLCPDHGLAEDGGAQLPLGNTVEDHLVFFSVVTAEYILRVQEAIASMDRRLLLDFPWVCPKPMIFDATQTELSLFVGSKLFRHYPENHRKLYHRCLNSSALSVEQGVDGSARKPTANDAQEPTNTGRHRDRPGNAAHPAARGGGPADRGRLHVPGPGAPARPRRRDAGRRLSSGQAGNRL